MIREMLLMSGNDVSLFGSPGAKIEYKHVLSFCKEGHKEGVDLDYKKDFPSDFSRLICSFANTQGGIVLIGIEEKGKTRKPKCPPKGVMCDPDVMRQRILSSSFDGIYPPVEPEVFEFEKPNDPGRFVFLVRITPSRLVHATDRRTKVYIRSKDSNRGYSLATIPELQWLWGRRSRSEQVAEQLISRAQQRVFSQAIGIQSDDGNDGITCMPAVEFSVVPQFPQYSQSLTGEELIDKLNEIGSTGLDWPDVSRFVPRRESLWRPVQGGAVFADKGKKPQFQYIDVGFLRHVYLRFGVSPTKLSELSGFEEEEERPILLAYIPMAYIALSLMFSQKFFQSINFRWPVKLAIKLENVENTLLYHGMTIERPDAERFITKACPDSKIELVTQSINANDFTHEYEQLIFEVAESLLWAYGMPWPEEKLHAWLERLTG
jgi:hypothetical protein